MTAVLLADLNLIAQVTAFIILIAGVLNAKKKKFNMHFKLGNAASILLSISFLWMGYSFLNNIPLLISRPAVPGSLLVFLHAVSGTAALFPAVSFLSGRFVEKTRIPMRLTFLMWTMAFLAGITMYVTYYLL